jgi:hypothetical protein
VAKLALRRQNFSSDRIGDDVKSNPVRTRDLRVTVYHAFDVLQNTKMSNSGISHQVITGESALDLFG